MPPVDDEALAFFNNLSGRLRIELDPPAAAFVPHMLNLAAAPGARITALRLEMNVLEDVDVRPLTDDEWARVVIHAPRLRMVSCESENVETSHQPPDGAAFTVRDLARAIEETERRGRGESEWLGGIDVHHVYFEGIEEDDGGVWYVNWGS